MGRIFFFLFIFGVSLFALENQMGSTGYVRIQTTLDDNKANECFKAKGAGSKYRLGNECETWLELGVYEDITLENGISLHNQVRPVFLGANNEKIDFLRFDEAYSELSNVVDNSVSFWAGRRFYKRVDSYMNDYFFFNMSGDGVGMSNLDFGMFKLSYAFMFNNINPKNVAGESKVFFQSHDLRFEKNSESWELVLFANYMKLNAKQFNPAQSIGSSDGYALGVLYTDKSFLKSLLGLEGKNTTGVFYGRDLAKSAGAQSSYLQNDLIEQMISSAKTPRGAKTFRFINFNGFENERFGLMSNLVYEYKNEKDFANIEQNWLSAGIRPYLFLGDYTRVLAELGYDYVDDKTAAQIYTLAKFSSALEFAFERGMWKKPVLRFFYTKAAWSENQKGLIGSGSYANDTSGDNLGVQLEYWW